MERDILFGFELEVEDFDFSEKRPVPPQGYVPFNSTKAHCQAGKCPNCGEEKPGITSGGKNNHGFQDRRVQNVQRALDRLEERVPYENPNWKCGAELFATNLNHNKDECSMLKCHPSRWAMGEFMCCGAKIWHDFCSFEEGKNFKKDTWNYYYKPTNNINEDNKEINEGNICLKSTSKTFKQISLNEFVTS